MSPSALCVGCSDSSQVHPASVIRGSSSGRGTIIPALQAQPVGGHDNVVPRGVLALQQRVQLTEPDVPGGNRSSVMVVPLMMVTV